MCIRDRYLTVAHFDNATAQAIMNEALKYQCWKYVYGGSNPNTSFDCSGLVQWCYGNAGISLPRTAQAQYDAPRSGVDGDDQLLPTAFSLIDERIGILLRE